jgi:hypothetical protein
MALAVSTSGLCRRPSAEVADLLARRPLIDHLLAT